MLKHSICRLSTQWPAAHQASRTPLLSFFSHTNLGGIIIAVIPVLRPGPGPISLNGSSCEHNHPSAGRTRLTLSCRAKAFHRISFSTFLVRLGGHCSERQGAGRATSSPKVPPRWPVEIDIRSGAGEVIMGQQGCSDLIRHRYHCRPSGHVGVQHLRDRLVEAEQCWRSAVQGSCP